MKYNTVDKITFELAKWLSLMLIGTACYSLSTETDIGWAFTDDFFFLFVGLGGSYLFGYHIPKRRSYEN